MFEIKENKNPSDDGYEAADHATVESDPAVSWTTRYHKEGSEDEERKDEDIDFDTDPDGDKISIHSRLGLHQKV